MLLLSGDEDAINQGSVNKYYNKIKNCDLNVKCIEYNEARHDLIHEDEETKSKVFNEIIKFLISK